jgi:hypothetical protein
VQEKASMMKLSPKVKLLFTVKLLGGKSRLQATIKLRKVN